MLNIFLQFIDNTVVLIDEDMDLGILPVRSIDLASGENCFDKEESGEDTQKQN